MGIFQLQNLQDLYGVGFLKLVDQSPNLAAGRDRIFD